MRTGDHVFHAPSEETWVVAWADPQTGYMAPCGWPTCEAKIADCTVTYVASDDESAELIERLSASGRTDAHRAKALHSKDYPLKRTPTRRNAMTEDQLKDFLESNRAEINAAIKAKLIAGLIETHRWEMSDLVAKTVNEFMAAEIVPEIKSYLQSEKSAILTASMEAARQIGDLITQQMVTNAAKNIAGYGFRDVMGGIFKP